MTGMQQMPFGTWPSPISAECVASSGLGSSAIPRELHADESGVYWLEIRTEESGRYVLQHRQPGGLIRTITPTGYSVRTRVHEYGGGSYLITHDGIYFSNEADQRLYYHSEGSPPTPITPEAPPGEQFRFANGCTTPDGNHLIYVCEHHQGDGKVLNYLAVISPKAKYEPRILTSGADFYANPRINPQGDKLLWLTWNLPNMPWESTQLWSATFTGEELTDITCIAGSVSESIFQPEWGHDDDIIFVSDRNGWWNLYRWKSGKTEPIIEREAEFGLPLWTLGYKTYTIVDQNRLATMFIENGKPHLGLIDIARKNLETISMPYNYYAGSIDADPDQCVWFIVGSPVEFPGISSLDTQDMEIRRIVDVNLFEFDVELYSRPEQIVFDSPGGGPSYAYYYPPSNPEFHGLPGDQPPLIVKGHGGPTSAARPYLNLDIQFWTSRGFAMVDVDYSGSTGYGREYRDRLKGQWGVIDVADCVEAAIELSRRGNVDPEKFLITGGSAGGYIVLRALTEYDIFAAGASHYGVSDILALMHDTHKFEAGYDTYLVGPYPESADLYEERSPINHVDKIRCPVILFQGTEDKVVLPSQSECIRDALEQKGVYVKYLTFEGEGHGFRNAENIKTALEEELGFYLEILEVPRDKV